MRVTESAVYRQAIKNISSVQSELFTIQEQAATGKKFQNIEDDPISAERIRLLQESQEKVTQYQENITRSRTQLEAADTALGEATNILIQAKEISIAAASDTYSAEDRAIFAQEVESLYESLVGIANTSAGGEYIFGGFMTDQAPFLNDGTFIGNNGSKEVDVGLSSRIEVNVSGADAFTVAGGIDVFQALEDLQTALEINDEAAIDAAIDIMESGVNQVSSARTDAGLKLNRLDVADSIATQLEDSLTSEKSDYIDIDTVQVLVDLNAAVTALENVLSVSQTVLGVSILNM